MELHHIPRLTAQSATGEFSPDGQSSQQEVTLSTPPMMATGMSIFGAPVQVVIENLMGFSVSSAAYILIIYKISLLIDAFGVPEDNRRACSDTRITIDYPILYLRYMCARGDLILVGTQLQQIYQYVLNLPLLLTNGRPCTQTSEFRRSKRKAEFHVRADIKPVFIEDLLAGLESRGIRYMEDMLKKFSKHENNAMLCGGLGVRWVNVAKSTLEFIENER